MEPTPTLYMQPTTFDRQAHRRLRLKPQTGWAVASRMTAVPVVVAEFYELCKDCMVGFVRRGPAQDGRPAELMPMALLGLRAGENLYVRPDGAWDAPYVPAYLRHYPFALAPQADGQRGLLFDAAWPGFNEAEGEALLDAAGEPTPWLAEQLRRLDAFDQDLGKTEAFVRLLQQHGLLKEMALSRDEGQPEPTGLASLFTVDEARLRALPDAALLDLSRRGALGLIQAQMIAMTNLGRLNQRLAARVASDA